MFSFFYREMCLNWRHRAGLVDQWSRVTLALTARLLMFMSGPNFPQMTIGKLNGEYEHTQSLENTFLDVTTHVCKNTFINFIQGYTVDAKCSYETAL